MCVEYLVFRLSEITSGAFSGTVSLVFIKKFWEKFFPIVVVKAGIERLIIIHVAPVIQEINAWLKLCDLEKFKVFELKCY